MAASFETIDLLLDRPSNGEAFLSSRLLYKFLHNNLRVGQWELARACIGTLLKQDGNFGKIFSQLLKNIVNEPLLYSDGSHPIATPFHLSWLASLELLELFKGKVELSRSDQKKIEFRLLLQSCNKEHVPLDCLQELDYYHTKIVDESQSSVLETIPNVNMSWMNPLKTLIQNQPRHAHAIIHCLIVGDARFASNNLFFYNLYLDLLKDQLNELTSLENALKRMADIGELDKSAESVLRKHSLCCKNVHQLLASLDVQSLTAQSEIDETIMNLLYKVQNNSSGNFTKGSLYSALLCHPSLCLFKRFCDIETEYQLGNSFKSLTEISPSPTFLVPSESLLTRTCDKDRPSAWKLLYLYARQDHHVLEDVVTTCVEFARQCDLGKVIEILSCEEFSPLKMLVLLLAWPHCHTCDSAQTLLDSLWDRERSSKHVLLDQACTKLEYQLHLVKWCLDKAKPLIAANESSSTEEHKRVYEMFQNLDSHSVLHVLHQSTNLSQLPEHEVLEMLQTRPVNTADSQLEMASDITQEISSDGEAEIRRDIALYHGFCALRGFLEVVLTGDNSGSDVTTKIQDSCDHVDAIYPITLRVEILENIFSLLFVSSENLLEDVSASYETDDLETLDSRSLRSSRTASFESFLSVDSRNASPWKPLRSSEQSASRPMSPEPLSKLDGERSKYSPSTDAETRMTKESANFRPSDLLKVGAASPESNSRKPVSARELNFDDVDGEQGEHGEVFRLQLAGSKEKLLLDTDERNMKGILMNKAMVCQFLDVLRECLNKVIRLKNESSESSQIHADWMKTSVSLATLDQRISRLGQYINEAQWRYQLVSTCCDVEDLEDEINDDQSNSCSDDSDMDSNIGKSGGTREERVSKPSKRRKNVSADGEFIKPLPKPTAEQTDIPRLLSSPSSLIYMCMKKDSYAQAKHITKLFNIEGDESSKAVHFAEEYEKSFQKLTRTEKSKAKERTSSNTPERKGRLSVLKNVASVAAAGVAATSTTSIVEELLLSASTDLASVGFTLTEPAHAHFLHALVCFDYLCTAQITKLSCKNFLEMAQKKMEIAMDIEPLTPYTLQRVTELLSNLESLLNDTDRGAIDSCFSDIKPLNAKSVRNEQELQSYQDNAFAKLEAAIDDGDTFIKSIAETSATELPAVLKFRKMEHKTAVRVAMHDFHNAFSCERDGRLLVAERGQWLAKHRLDYVQSLYNHVNMLSMWELYWKLNPRERSNVYEGPQKSMALKATNPFVVLTQGFDDIAGKPLFERNVPPRKMESMCRKMNVNLIRIIVHNCCPVVPAVGPLRRRGNDCQGVCDY